MGSQDRQTAYIAMIAAPFIAVAVITVSISFVRLPTFVYMAFPIALLGYGVGVLRVVNGWAVEPGKPTPASAAEQVDGHGQDGARSLQRPGAGSPAETRSAFASIRAWAPFVLFGIVSFLVWFIPAMLLVLFVMLGFGVGYFIATETRVQRAIQRQIVTGGYSAPWWSTSHTSVRWLRNALYLSLGLLVIVALLFLPLLGIALVVGLVTGPWFSGAAVRESLTTLGLDQSDI